MPPRLTRTSSEAVVAGVCAGLAEHLGVPVRAMRLAFVVLTVAGGTGVLLYAGFWMAVPQAHGDGRTPSARAPAVAVLAVAAAAAVLAGLSGFWFDRSIVAPVALGAAGLALIWRQADDDQRARWARAWDGQAADRRVAAVRLGLGTLLVVAGVTAFLAATDELQGAREGMVAILATVAGIALVAGPWAWRLVTDLAEERRARIRAHERAEVAAHVHDSVLQTLALVQRHAGDPRLVQRLARTQERELRAWLYEGGAPSAGDGFAGAVESAAADVEAAYGVPIEVVTVGDTPLDDAVQAVVQAAREAMVNASKFSGAPEVSVFAEVHADGVTVFVRDTGCGYEPAAVPPDRRGVSESIVGRMRRHGGRADVRTAPGEGTEVELVLERPR